MTRPLALVTGASSGIGTSVAVTLAHSGYDLVLVARREDRLAALADHLSALGARSEVLGADLSDRAGLRSVVARAGTGDLDVLVSNAGVSAYGPFSDLDPDELEQAWTLNADAAPVLARAALPEMISRGRGGIITVASNLAFSAGVPSAVADAGRSLPQRVLYVAAKAALVAFTRTLAGELAGTGVQATVVCPGLVSSEWNGGASQGPYAMSPDDVAQATWAAFSRGEVVCLPGLDEIDLLDRLAETERQIMSGNIGSQLASRYRS